MNSRTQQPNRVYSEVLAGSALGRRREQAQRHSTLTGTEERSPASLDTKGLEAELRRRIRGEVRFDDGSRALYATDGSNYRQVPIGVVIPRHVDDVVETVAVARRFDAPILARGCGTSLAGQCCNIAVVIDCSKYLHHILEIDPERRRARVQPGTILDDLRRAAEQYHLTFGPDPATHNHCTLGGMIGNNSCGVHSVMAGRTADNVEELEVLTYDGLRLRVGCTSDEELEHIIRAGGRRGEIYAQLKALLDRHADLIRGRYPKIPRRVSGYNLDELLPENGFHVARALVGSESTCVTVLEATLRLVHSPPARSLLVLGYPDVYAAGDHIPEIMEAGPVGCEGLDDRLIGYMHKKGMRSTEVAMLPPGAGWLLVEFGGEDKQESDAQARRLMERLKRQSHPPSMKLFDDPAEEHKLWEVRESGLGATANVPGMRDTWPGWEDSAVPPDKLGGYLRDLRRLFEKHGYECSLYGHFGQACVHVRIDFDLETRAGIDNYLSFIDEAADLVVSYGGSLSGEHGDGQARAALLPKMYGPELMQAFREFKTVWDPAWRMNPGKVVEAYGPDQNLRLGTDYHPWNPPTHFRLPDDHGSLARSALRCVGVGKCRRMDGGTMCPSFMVTREEEHSTRGRARLLFEMLQQDVIGSHGWRDDHVKEALDLCLACKGCKGDCPVNVDMATYKSEFLSHYYEGRWRPRSAYAFGLIFYWARAAALMPNVVNFLAQAPGLSTLTKAMAGMAQERRIPYFAPQTFRDRFRRHPPQNVDGPPVILWPDTFNNCFHPETAQAAVRVLEAAGYRVLIPRRWLCCGRPLYDYGMLDRAKGLLRRIMTELRAPIADGLPIVVLEPSCAAVFRDELVNLFPHDGDAKRLHQQTFLLSEFLERQADGFKWPKWPHKALVHGHCHHKAVMGMESEEALLSELGLDFEVLDSGCCGMAGSFGFEAGEHYDVSVKAGERMLLPAVRGASKDTVIIADGFSCREQIAQMTDRRALHLAQVIDMALRQQRLTPAHQCAEAAYLEQTNRAPSRPALTTAACVGAGAVLAGGLLAWALQKRRAV